MGGARRAGIKNHMGRLKREAVAYSVVSLAKGAASGCLGLRELGDGLLTTGSYLLTVIIAQLKIHRQVSKTFSLS